MGKSKQTTTKAVMAGLKAVLLFGFSFVTIKIALEQVEPMTLIPVRFALDLIVI